MLDAGEAEHILDQLWHSLCSDPKELHLCVVNQVTAVRGEAFGGEVHGGGEDNLAGSRVRETTVVGHVVEGVELGVDILHQEGSREGGEET